MPETLTDHALPELLPEWGVLVLESHHSSQFEMEWRTHDFLKLVYVLNGKGTFHLDELPERFRAGDVIVVTAGTRNRIEDDLAASLYVCCINRKLLEFDPSILNSLETQVIRHDKSLSNRSASILRRMIHNQERDRPGRSIALVADGMKLVQAICEHKPQLKQAPIETADRATVRRYIEGLATSFFDETTIDQAAQSMGIPRRTFTKIFAEITGQTWLQYTRKLAIDHAKRRLDQTDLSIASIAFECGFTDLSTFYRQFKSHCGISPGEFRNQRPSR